MNYFLVFYAPKEIRKLTLLRGESVTAGAGENDSMRLDGFGLSLSHLILTATDVGVHALSTAAPFEVFGESAFNRVLSVGDTALISESLSLAVFEKRSDVKGEISLTGAAKITIGRSRRNDISLNGSQVSSSHAVLRRESGEWTIEDLKSRNGTFLNGKSASPGRAVLLGENRIAFIGGFEFTLRGDSLMFGNTAGECAFSSKLKRKPTALNATEITYPFFQRSPRLRPEAETLEVEISQPPSAGQKPSVSWLSVLLPPVMMIAVMLAVSLFMKSYSMMVYTIPMSLVSIILAVVNYRTQMKQWRNMSRLAQEKYAAHLRERESEVTESESKFLMAVAAVNPDVYTCASFAEGLALRLWERGVRDDDFLSVRLGTGTIRSNVKIKIPQKQLTLEEDQLLEQAQKLKDRHETLTGAPVTYSFLSESITGLAGSRDAMQKISWTVLAGIAARHSYEDVKIVCVYPKSEAREWEWVRWLPHVWNEGRTERFVACASGDAAPLLRAVGDILKTRRRNAANSREGRETQNETPFYLLLLADKSLVEESGTQLLPESARLGMAVIYAYGDIGLLPGECHGIIECGAGDGAIRLKSASKRVPFRQERVTLDLMNSFARALSPIRLKTSSVSLSIPDNITFMQGYGERRVEELDAYGRWSRNKPFKSIAAPIGIRENGEVFAFDIHEKKHGPHGIVAGTSGSGKSEALTTWLLSLALNFHPHDVSFVLIDFKGDGLSGILKTLPHVAGVISNVNDASIVERSMRSLHGEITRRELVFAESGVNNIHKYQEIRHDGRLVKGRPLDPMPYLIIVIDEFAEMKTQYPEQMDEFVSIARTGRSLGMYMVLSMQSPGGVVAGQVEANSKFRICLRTANIGESKEILGTQDAYMIQNRHPGRAYVKVGAEVYEQVQTFYSRAAYSPDAGRKGPARINIVKLNGERICPEVHDEAAAHKASTDLEEGQAVGRYIEETATKHGVSNTRSIWTDPLPKQISLSMLLLGREAFKNGEWTARNEGLSVTVGLVDDPAEQRQYPLVLDFFETGHQALYGAPSSGKTTFLQTVLLSAATCYTPCQVQFLVLDFGAWGMKIFDRLPHTLLVADSNDEAKVKDAEAYILSEIAERKTRFSKEGVGTLEGYMDKTGKSVPAIIIVIDNMASLHERHPDFLDSLGVIAREGGGLGLYLMMSAGSQGSFMYRIAQYIKSSYALQLTDRADYRPLVGGDGKMEPANFPGRGFTKGPLEFQTALCVEEASEGARARKLEELCRAISDAWKGPRAEMFNTSDIAASLTSDELRVQIGVGKETREPFDFVFADMNGCVISGSPGSGKTNVLGLIARALHKDGGTRLYIHEKGSRLASLCEGARVARNSAESDAFLAELASEYDRRSENGINEPRVALCLDDFVEFYNDISYDAADRLDVIIRCGAECGMYVYIAGDTDGLIRHDNLMVKPVKSCLTIGNAIALGGRLKNHSLFDGIYNSEDIALGESEGCVISNRKVWRVKIALLAPIEAA
ncbi:type VII secretion protein EssC [Synergistales bacterium]|nr:type VII secretion protein EssC [Synergistales bacterium]